MNTATNILEAIGGAGRVHAMTGAKFMTGANELHILFGRRVGESKIDRIIIKYDEALDLFSMEAGRYMRKQLRYEETQSCHGAYIDQIKTICERWSGLHFSL